jgi:hypothetical protein
MSSSSDGSTFNTDITADPGKFEQGMAKAVASAAGASDAINAQFKKIGEATSKVLDLFTKMTLVLAGGGALKKFITDANEWNSTAGKMAVQLGTTSEKASVLNVALTRLGIDSDTYLGASQKLSKQVQSNSAAFDVLGVKVRDASGAYRPVTELMGEVNQKLAEITNPIEQNIAGQQVYGKGWAEVRSILKLTSEQMQASEARARELGLIVGPEGVAMSKQYTLQMRDLGLVANSLEHHVGSALLPVFVQLGAVLSKHAGPVAQAFGETMETVGRITQGVFGVVTEFVGLVLGGFKSMGAVVTSAMGVDAVGGMELFGNALKVVEMAFVGLRTATQLGLEFIKYMVEGSVQNVLRFADVTQKALALDFEGAKRAWANGTKIIEETQAEHWENMKRIAGEGAAQMNEIALRGGKAEPAAAKGPDLSKGPKYQFKPDEKPGESRMAGWQAELSERKAAIERQGLLEGKFRQMSLADERAYWGQLMGLSGLSEAEKSALTRKAAELEMADIKNTFDVRVKTLHAEEEAYKNNFGEKLRIELQVQAMYAKGTTEYAEAEKRIAALRREAAQQAQQVAQAQADARRQALLSGIALEEQTLQQAEALGLVSHEQVLAQEQQFEERRYQIAYAALQDRLALLAGSDEDPVKLAQTQAEKEALEQGHQLRLNKIKGDLSQTQLDPVVNVYKAAEQALGGAINGMINRTMTLGQAMKTVWQSITSTVISEISKQLAKKVAAWAVEKALALAGIGTKAVEAGAGAAASAASIPYVGWILAIGALAAVMGAVNSAKSSVPSAYAGYDIPAGLNPMTQLHEREMVLPAKHADVIRLMAESQTSAPGAGGGGGVTLNGVPMPGGFFMANQKELVQALTHAQRNNVWNPTR